MSGSKTAKRNEYRNLEPANSVRLGDAIQELEGFFNERSPHWKIAIPVGFSIQFVPQVKNFKILLTEYRRMRVELLDTRNQLSHTQFDLLEAYKQQFQSRHYCRRRLQPVVRLLLK